MHKIGRKKLKVKIISCVDSINNKLETLAGKQPRIMSTKVPTRVRFNYC